MPDLPPRKDFESTFDARLYEPPSWAAGHMKPQSKDMGESNSSDNESTVSSPTSDLNNELRKLGLEPDNDSVRFTNEELTKLLAEATKLKEAGNKHFTASPRKLEEARDSYLAALGHLPDIHSEPVPPPPPSGLQELTDDEAAALEAEGSETIDAEKEERAILERDIRECTKAVWGNLAAVYLALEQYKETVDACSNALKIDEAYTKALHRRGTANERIGSWSSLTAAQDDYTKLLPLLHKASPQLPEVRRSLATLPQRITVQQDKEKDEMLGKLKDLGNSLLGKFGLSTDMFKFEQGEGGGYNMRFGS